MALSRLAREFAAEINNLNWSDAPFRADRAGHRREHDRHTYNVPQLDPGPTSIVRINVMWVTAQVLAHADPNLHVYEFAEACGVDTRTPSGRPRSGVITARLRWIRSAASTTTPEVQAPRHAPCHRLRDPPAEPVRRFGADPVHEVAVAGKPCRAYTRVPQLTRRLDTEMGG